MAITIEPPPYQSDVTQSDTNRRMSLPWLNWITLALLRLVQTSSAAINSVTLTGQHAAIGVTALVPLASAGTYRVNWYLRVTTADGVASSVALAIGSTDGGIAITQSGAAVTGDTTATVQSGSFIVQADGATPIAFSTTYSSNTPAKMQYFLRLVAESVG